MDLVEQIHIFGLSNIHTYGSNISLIRLFNLIFNYAKPRIRIKSELPRKSPHLTSFQIGGIHCQLVNGGTCFVEHKHLQHSLSHIELV